MDDDGQHVGAHKLLLLLLLLCDNMWWFNQLTYLQVMFGIKNNSQNKPYVSIDIFKKKDKVHFVYLFFIIKTLAPCYCTLPTMIDSLID